MLEVLVRPRDGKKKLILKIPVEILRKGDDFLLLLDKFLKKSKIKPVELEEIKLLRISEKLGITSRRVIETAVTVFNNTLQRK